MLGVSPLVLRAWVLVCESHSAADVVELGPVQDFCWTVLTDEVVPLLIQGIPGEDGLWRRRPVRNVKNYDATDPIG